MVLKISDYDGRRVLAFDLRHLLPLVADVGADLSWHVLPCGETTWFLGELSALKEVQEFSDRIEASEAGVQLTWCELQELAATIHQCVWGAFVGVRPSTPWDGVTDMFADDGRYIDRATADFFEAVEIAFQAVESSFWLVYARNDEVRDRLRAAFDDVEVIDVVPTN